MANNELSEAFKKNWYILAISAVLVLGGIAYGVMSGGEPEEVTLASEDDEFQELNSDSPTGASANENFVKRSSSVSNNEKQGLQKEKEYLAKLEDATLSDEEYGLTLYRLANVYYSALGEYETAIGYFRQVVDDYPNHTRAKDSWRYMADCYSKLEQPDEEIKVYNEMLRKYPEGSEQHTWARRKLQVR